jgi:hypothetical protein
VYQAYARRNPYVESYEIYTQFFVQIMNDESCIRPSVRTRVFQFFSVTHHGSRLKNMWPMFKNAIFNYIANVTPQR